MVNLVLVLSAVAMSSKLDLSLDDISKTQKKVDSCLSSNCPFSFAKLAPSLS